MTGFADGFTTTADAEHAVATNMSGGFWRINTSDGGVDLWTPAEGGAKFANELAAYDQESNTAYFTIRSTDDTTAEERYFKRGMIVAMDAATWTQKWTRRLPEGAWAGNTPPLIWGDRVIVGDTKGTLYAFNKATGEPADLVNKRWKEGSGYTDTSSDLSQVSLIKTGERPFLADQSYRAASGAGVQPIISDGGTGQPMLIMGVNYCTDGNPDWTAPCAPGKQGGRLVALRAQPDALLLGLSCPPQSTNWFDATVFAAYRAPSDQVGNLSINLTYTDSQGKTGNGAGSLAVAPNSSGRQSFRIADVAPGPVTVTARVSIPGDGRAENNLKSCTVVMKECTSCGSPPPHSAGSVLTKPNE